MGLHDRGTDFVHGLGGHLICSDILTFRRGGVIERGASLVARQFLAAAAAFGILVLAACGTLSPQDLTAIAELEPSPTPVADVVAMFGGSPSGDGVFAARGPTFAPDEAWRFPAADITSPPVVSGGLVLVSVADGASESGFYLSAFDARAQRELWRFATGRQVYSAPAVSDGVVYLASTDSRLYALDAATGEEQWRFQAVGGSWASPVVSDGTVFFTASDGHLYALDATTGEERWRFELFGPRQLDANSFGRGTWLSPSVHDGTVYAGSLDWHLYAIDATTGQEQWRFKTRGSVWGSPAISDGMVYFGSNDLNLYAVDAATRRGKVEVQVSLAAQSFPCRLQRHGDIPEGIRPRARRRHRRREVEDRDHSAGLRGATHRIRRQWPRIPDRPGRCLRPGSRDRGDVVGERRRGLAVRLPDRRGQRALRSHTPEGRGVPARTGVAASRSTRLLH